MYVFLGSRIFATNERMDKSNYQQKCQLTAPKK